MLYQYYSPIVYYYKVLFLICQKIKSHKNNI